MRRLVLAAFLLSSGAALALAASSAASAADSPGVPKVGFVFASKTAVLREAPADGAKEIGRVPAGIRLVFRRVVDPGPTWYRVEPPGGRVGWIAASDVSTKRPGAGVLPRPQPVEVMDSGVGLAKTAGAQTAAARGLSKAAVEYAADRKELEQSADQFVTLENFVNAQFQDPYDANGNYPDVDRPGRIEHAAKFKGGIE